MEIGTVNVLGTPYRVLMKKYKEEPAFERSGIDGYCDSHQKITVVCDMATYPGWEHEPTRTVRTVQKGTLRHEIVHAFLNESGLQDSAFRLTERAWARNEEMVDWIAIQGPKIYKAWRDIRAV